MEMELVAAKGNIQAALRLLQLHPCYIIQILKQKLVPFDMKKQIIRQLFTVNKKSHQHRLNYLLMTIFEALLVHELRECTPLPDDEEHHPYIFGKDCQMISIYIFRRVFKSDQRNVDTICCIACHVINSILMQFT